MDDITILMLTPNLVPKGWAEYHKQVLLAAADGAPIITISCQPLDWGINVIQDDPLSVSNVYKQMLRGAKLAETPYVGIAEDDTLYDAAHFKYRPPDGQFAFNMNRWGIFAWRVRHRPVFFYKPRQANMCLIAPRELLIEDLEGRFERTHGAELPPKLWYDPGRSGGYSAVNFFTHIPVLFFNHVNGIDPLEQRRHKKEWPVQCYELPGWGRSEDIKRKFA